MSSQSVIYYTQLVIIAKFTVMSSCSVCYQPNDDWTETEAELWGYIWNRIIKENKTYSLRSFMSPKLLQKEELDSLVCKGQPEKSL